MALADIARRNAAAQPAPADPAAADPAAMPPDEESGEDPTVPEDEASEPAPGGGGATFEKKDISAVIPPEMVDIVERVVAAGKKLMYSQPMRKQLMAALQGKDPIAKRLAENVTGLMLTLDQRAQQSGQKGGIPAEAIFPAGYELLGEAGMVMVKAGIPVSQEDFNAGAQMLFVFLGKKMGGSDEDIMGAAAKQVQGGADAEAAPPPEGAEPPEGMPPADGAPPAGMPPAGPNMGTLTPPDEEMPQ